jgi:plastocyanin
VSVTNSDNAHHTWTADSGQPDSWDVDLPGSGTGGSHTFNASGTFKYHCNIHATMVGSVSVS